MAEKSYGKFLAIDVHTEGLEKVAQKIKEASNLGMEEGMKKVANNLKVAASSKSPPLEYTGYLINSIQEVQLGENEYGVKMMNYGKWLNDAPATAHWVSLKPGRSIRLWAISKGLLIGKPYGRGGTMLPGREYGSKNIQKMWVLSDKQHRYGGWIDQTLVDAPEIIRSSIQGRINDLS